MPPKLPLPQKGGLFLLFQHCPFGEGVARQLSGKTCLAAILASRHLDASNEVHEALEFSRLKIMPMSQSALPGLAPPYFTVCAPVLPFSGPS